MMGRILRPTVRNLCFFGGQPIRMKDEAKWVWWIGRNGWSPWRLKDWVCVRPTIRSTRWRSYILILHKIPLCQISDRLPSRPQAHRKLYRDYIVRYIFLSVCLTVLFPVYMSVCPLFNYFTNFYWHMGTHRRVLSESYPMNTNMTGFRWVSKTFAFLALDKSCLALEAWS